MNLFIKCWITLDNAILEPLAIMVYALLCHALQIWQLYSSAQNEKETENRLFVQIKSGRILYSLWAFFNKTIYAPCWLSTISYPTKREWNNCWILIVVFLAVWFGPLILPLSDRLGAVWKLGMFWWVQSYRVACVISCRPTNLHRVNSKKGQKETVYFHGWWCGWSQPGIWYISYHGEWSLLEKRYSMWRDGMEYSCVVIGRCNISNRRRSVSSPAETLRRELKNDDAQRSIFDKLRGV